MGRAAARLWAICALSAAPPTHSDDLVAPGALAEYGGGEARLKRGKIRAPAEGFFVGGSSIGEMNGVYTRVYRWQVAHEFVYCYRKWPADEPDRMEVSSTPHRPCPTAALSVALLAGRAGTLRWWTRRGRRRATNGC